MKKHALAIAAAAIMAAAGPVVAADLEPRPMYKAPPVLPPVQNWTGPYVGLNLGGAVSNIDTTATARGLTTTAKGHLSGVIGGGQIGYNYQLSNWVFGLETDFQGSSQRANTTTMNFTETDSMPWFGTARGRIGYTPIPGWLAYATGGLAYGETKATGAVAGAGAFNVSNTHAGWTVGGGVEAAVFGNWTVKAEYLFIDLGNVTFNTTIGGIPITSRNHIEDNVGRVGLNYHF